MLLLADWYWQESGLLVMGSYVPSFASVLIKEPGEVAVMFFFLSDADVFMTCQVLASFGVTIYVVAACSSSYNLRPKCMWTE